MSRSLAKSPSSITLLLHPAVGGNLVDGSFKLSEIIVSWPFLIIETRAESSHENR